MRVRFWLSELHLWNLSKLHTPKHEDFDLLFEYLAWQNDKS